LRSMLALRNRICAAVVTAMLATGALPARAVTFTVDDSASRIESQSPTRFNNTGSGVGSTLLVNAVLDLRPWVGRHARIYMVLPPQPLATLRLQWRSQGRLQPGQLTGGQRALVFDGPITTPLLRDRLELLVQMDGRELLAPQRLNLSFEIDLP
jgi:hypothetical protein